MARTVGTPAPVIDYATGNTEVQDEAPVNVAGTVTAGLAPTALQLNTLYETKRGAICADYRPLEGSTGINPPTVINDNFVGVLGRFYYRLKTQGRGSLPDESVAVSLWLTAVDGGDPAPGTAQIDVRVPTPAGSTAMTWLYTGDIATPTEVSIGSVNINDVTEYQEIRVELVSNGAANLVDVKIYGASFVYERNKTALTAGEYSNGVAPLELSQYAGEKPVSTARQYDAHTMALDLYQHRVGQVVSSAFVQPASRINGTSTLPTSPDGTVWTCTPPRDVTVLRVHLYDTSGGGLLTATSNIDSVTVGLGLGWNTVDLDVTPLEPQDIRITVETDQIIGISAYWVDSAKPGAA